MGSLFCLLASCSPASGPADGSAGDLGVVCTSNVQCDDQLFCNGVERCLPGNVSANARGCVAGMPPCASGMTCNEQLARCATSDGGGDDCDQDGDGERAATCPGGTDCDDHDVYASHSRAEQCDGMLPDGRSAADHDEDCNPCTVSGPVPDGDHDGDRYAAGRCSNPFTPGMAPVGCDAQQTRINGITSRVFGSDCNDDPGPLVSQDAGSSDASAPVDGSSEAGALDASVPDASAPDASPWDGGLSASQYAAALVAQSFPRPTEGFLQVRAGQSQTVWIELRNVGRATWDSSTRLGTTLPRNHADPFAGPDWHTNVRPGSVAPGVAVPPGGTYRFTFTYVVPDGTPAGFYPSHFGMLQEGVDWFAPPGQGGPADNTLGALLLVLDASAGNPGAGLTGREVHPAQPELCNGVDDNCSGEIDEGDPGSGGSCATGIPGACSPGVAHCRAGAVSCLPNVYPGVMAEACNGLDDDCDGLTDNIPGLTSACSTGMQGVCAQGHTACSGSSTACIPDHIASPEVCEGLDNDCRGGVDDGSAAAMSCSAPNLTPSCVSGRCDYSRCNVNYANCDGNNANGCEVNTTSDPRNCGVCGRSCTAPTGGSVSCSSGNCVATCPASTVSCPGICRATVSLTAPLVSQPGNDNFMHQCGYARGPGWTIDPAAVPAGGCYMTYGPYTSLARGSYTAVFRLNSEWLSGSTYMNTLANPPMTLDVFGTGISSTALNVPVHFPGSFATAPANFSVDFTVTSDCATSVEFRIHPNQLPASQLYDFTSQPTHLWIESVRINMH